MSFLMKALQLSVFSSSKTGLHIRSCSNGCYRVQCKPQGSRVAQNVDKAKAMQSAAGGGQQFANKRQIVKSAAEVQCGGYQFRPSFDHPELYYGREQFTSGNQTNFGETRIRKFESAEEMPQSYLNWLESLKDNARFVSVKRSWPSANDGKAKTFSAQVRGDHLQEAGKGQIDEQQHAPVKQSIDEHCEVNDQRKASVAIDAADEEEDEDSDEPHDRKFSMKNEIAFIKRYLPDGPKQILKKEPAIKGDTKFFYLLD